MIQFLKCLRIFGCLFLLDQILDSSCYGHGGEDHGHEQDHKAEESQNPSGIRKTSNALIVPKGIQTRLKIRVEPVQEQTIKGTVRLIGHVISDPSGYARLQATQNARVINDPEYPFPIAGQKVKKNQVLMAVQPTLTKVESSEQRILLYKAESEVVQLKKEVDRKAKLGQYASPKELENAQSELDRAIKQKEEIINKTFQPEYLISPLDGFVADIHVRQGEIVTPEKTLVEVVDSTKLMVEAFVFDPTIAHDITGGSAELPLYSNATIPLKLVGVSPKVTKEDQSTHVVFKVEGTNPSIKMDMALEVLADLGTAKPTLVIPKRAVVDDGKGAWVFVQTAPEIFETRKIDILKIIDGWVSVGQGLSIGDRIVVDGAYLLKQAT